MHKSDKEHFTIHGAGKGRWGVKVLDKPQQGTRKDHILFYWQSSRKGDKAGWLSMTDFEALSLASMLTWALIKRNKKVRLEVME